jgi:hypothetical protein
MPLHKGQNALDPYRDGGMIFPLTYPPSETPGIRGQDPEYKYTGKTRKFLLFVSCGKYAFKSLCLPK